MPIKAFSLRAIAVLVFTLLTNGVAHAQYNADVAHYHTPIYNSFGKLVPWHIDENGPFDYIMDIEAKWWLKAPKKNGWPIYLTASKLTRTYEQSNGAVPGSACPLAIMAYLKYYSFTGNKAYLDMVKTIGDYLIRQCMTPSTYAGYPDFPWPAGETGDITPNGGGHPNTNAGELMPDKGAMVGYSLIQLFKATGDSAYLKAAVKIADVLSDNAVQGNTIRSPWPFKVDAQSGDYISGAIAGNQSFALRLFDELLEAGIQGNGKYKTTRNNVWHWLKSVAMADTSGSKWQDFFEDHSGNEDNPTQICALETARYLLEKRELLDAEWFEMVGSIVRLVKREWAVHQGSFTAIGEQQMDMEPYNSHTARYASILAMYYEAGANLHLKEEAYSSFAYSTYSVDEDGFADTYFNQNIAWTTDSFGDWMLHFMDGLAAVPEWVSGNSSHMLRSTSVITDIVYNKNSITYSVFGNSGQEKLKLNFKPTEVQVNGTPDSAWEWDSTSQVLTINRSHGNSIAIL